MKESFWGYFVVSFGLVIAATMIFINTMTSTTEEDFYLVREIMQSSMIDSVDYGTYRSTGRLVMSEQKFVEIFLRRFAESVTNSKTYQISFYDIYEEPPKATVRIRTSAGVSSKTETFDVNLDTVQSGILETIYGVNFYEEPVYYTLTYDSNGGNTCNPASKTMEKGKTWGTLCVPQLSYNVFDSWNTEKDGSGIIITAATPVSSDLTVYAQWKKHKVNIKYNANGSGVTFSSSLNPNAWYLDSNGYVTNKSNNIHYIQTVDAGSMIDLPDYNGGWFSFIRSGYTVKENAAWKAGNETFTQAEKIKVDSLVNGCDLSKQDCDVTLYLNWKETETQYTLTLDANGGTIPVTTGWNNTADNKKSTRELSKGDSVSLPSANQSEYGFSGWTTTKNDYTTKVNNPYTMLDGNVTLYAGWWRCHIDYGSCDSTGCDISYSCPEGHSFVSASGGATTVNQYPKKTHIAYSTTVKFKTEKNVEYSASVSIYKAYRYCFKGDNKVVCNSGHTVGQDNKDDLYCVWWSTNTACQTVAKNYCSNRSNIRYCSNTNNTNCTKNKPPTCSSSNAQYAFDDKSKFWKEQKKNGS